MSAIRWEQLIRTTLKHYAQLDLSAHLLLLLYQKFLTVQLATGARKVVVLLFLVKSAIIIKKLDQVSLLPAYLALLICTVAVLVQFSHNLVLCLFVNQDTTAHIIMKQKYHVL
jgi:hypothetical protein